jgi:wobble nucleotide-excising tRNase
MRKVYHLKQFDAFKKNEIKPWKPKGWVYGTQLTENVGTQINVFIQTLISQTRALNQAINEQQDMIVESLPKIFEVLTKTFDNTTQYFVSQFEESSNNQVSKFQNTINEQTEMLKKSIENQQKALNEKLQETSELVTELQNLTAVKKSMENLEKATAEQNEKIDRVADVIKALAQSQQIVKNPVVHVQVISKRFKIALITGIGVLSGTVLSLVVLFIVKHFME